LPEFLGEKPNKDPKPNLFHFFQPQAGTKELFEICAAALGGGRAAATRVLWAALYVYWSWLVPARLFGGLFVMIAWHQTSGLFLHLCALLGVFCSLIVAVVSLAWAFLAQFTRELPGNFFGLCSGMDGSGTARVGQALTPWLAA